MTFLQHRVEDVTAQVTGLAIGQGLVGLPADLKGRLNSDDPAVRGEALVDTLALTSVSTVIVGKLQQSGNKALTWALKQQAALQAEAQAIAKAKAENNVYRDGARFDSNFDKAVPLANIRLEYGQEIGRIYTKPQNMLKQGASEETIARWAASRRDEIKMQYKDMTSTGVLTEIEIRNLKNYGNPQGPTIDELRESGKSWTEIIESASRPRGRDLDLSPPGFNK